MTKTILSGILLLGTFATPALAEMEFSVYSGWQTSPHSRISGDYPGTGAEIDALIGWEGRSFEMPPYYGVRGTWWKNETLGFGLEFTHAKVYAPDSEKAAIGFSDLEFTDGLNILTVNA
jgi:lipid A oxidase